MRQANGHTAGHSPGALSALMIALVGASSLVLTGCSDDAAEPTDQSITIIGSSTVFPFAQQVAKVAMAENDDLAAPDIASTGTSEGVAEFCKGEGPDTADIVNASRRMSVAEFEECQANGVSEIIEVKIGRDGIVFATDLEKGFDFNLTPDAIYRALSANPFGQEQGARAWREVDETLPNEPIVVYGPSPSSGTRDALMDVIMMPACASNRAMAALEQSDPAAFEANCHTLRDDSAYIAQGEKDELIVGKIANNPRAIGIFGYSYLEENAGTIKALTLDGVAPSAETIASGRYPGSRPLYFYVKKAHIGLTPGLLDYLASWPKEWKISGSLAQIGLVPAMAEDQAANAQAIADQTTLRAQDLGEG